MKLRIVALKCRPGMFEKALAAGGKPTPCGQFVEVADPVAQEILNSKVAFSQPTDMPLADKVQMGLCGAAREAWLKAGQPLRDEATVAGLKAICTACDQLKPNFTEAQRAEVITKYPSNPDFGLCRSWSCTHAGRRAATWDCPAGKWPAA